jgi:hypothetical protein
MEHVRIRWIIDIKQQQRPTEVKQVKEEGQLPTFLLNERVANI